MEAKNTLHDWRGSHSTIHRSKSSLLNERLSWEGAKMPAMCSQHSLLQPVIKGRNRTMASRKDKILNIRTPLHVQYIFALDLHNIKQQCGSVTHLNAAVVWLPCCTMHCSRKSMDEGNNSCVAASTSLPQTSILIYTKNYTSLSTPIFCSGSTWHPSQWFVSTNRTMKWVAMRHLLHMMLALCPSAMGALQVYCRSTFSLSNYTY